MKIETLIIKNFKTFKDVEMRDIPNFCVILGANGSGKTTLFNIFGFLKAALETDVEKALCQQGGFDEVRSRDSEGDIEIKLKFRSKNTGEKGKVNPLITYSVKIGKDERGHGIVEEEVLKYRRSQRGRPWEFLKFSRGVGKVVTNENPEALQEEKDLIREEQKLKSEDILAIKGLAQFEKFPSLLALGELIGRWHLSDIHITDAKVVQPIGTAEHLSTSGDNLSLVIENFHRYHPKQMQEIKDALKNRIPGIVDVKAHSIKDTGSMLLKIKDKSFEKPFLVNRVSDGTIKMLAYLVLLYDPNPHTLLCVEEPENQLYHDLLEELAEEFRAYANRGEQVFVSTHSPDFLNAVKMKEVFFLIKKDGYTTIKPASEDEQIKVYMDRGDKMGRLWKQGFFEGVGL